MVGIFEKEIMSSVSKENDVAESISSGELSVNKVENTHIKLSELKVVELKFQLESRDLDKTGIKSVLMERLKNALLEEAKNPEEYTFEVPIDSVSSKSVKRKKTSLEGNNEDSNLYQDEEMETQNANEVALQLSVEDEEVQFHEENSTDESSKVDCDVTEPRVECDLEPTSSESISNEVVTEPKAKCDLDPTSSESISNEVVTSPQEEVQNIVVENSTKLSEIKNVPVEKSEVLPLPDATSPESLCVSSNVLKVNKIVGKTDKVKYVPLTAKSLCVTGLANATRAADLKILFTKQGRVLSVKIIKSAKQVPGKCYAFVTMASSKDASKAIQNLHRTELNGRIISVERSQSDTNPFLKKPDSKFATLALKKQTATKSIASIKTIAESNKTISEPSKKLSENESEKLMKEQEDPSDKSAVITNESITNKELAKIKTKEIKSKPKDVHKSKAKEIIRSKQTVKSKGKEIIKGKLEKEKEKKADKVKEVEKSKEKIMDKGKEKNTAKTRDVEKEKMKEKRSHEVQSHKEYRSHIRKPLSSYSRPFSFHDRSRYGTFRRPFSRGGYSYRSSFRPTSFPSNYRLKSSLSLTRIREERLLERERFRPEVERRRISDVHHSRFSELAEIERLRDTELLRHRMIERKQKEEALRLEREKERLQLEREILERERAEILRLEREKQRLERERLEREKEELKRQAELRLNNKRAFTRVDRDPDPYWNDRKRSILPRYENRSTFHTDSPSTSRYEVSQRERPSYSRQNVERSSRYSSNSKPLEVTTRSSFVDRDSRREITIRSKDERQLYSRNDFRDRDNRRSFTSRERERQTVSRRDPPRDEWKHERRVRERVVAPSSTSTSSGQRKMSFY